MQMALTIFPALFFGHRAIPTLSAPRSIQGEMDSFKANAEACQHFAQEWDNSLLTVQQKEIQDGVDKYCAGSGKRHIPVITPLRDAQRRRPPSDFTACICFSEPLCIFHHFFYFSLFSFIALDMITGYSVAA